MQWQQQVNHAINYTFPKQSNTLHNFLGIEKLKPPVLKAKSKRNKPSIIIPPICQSIKFNITSQEQTMTIALANASQSGNDILTTDTIRIKRKRQVTIHDVAKNYNNLPLKPIPPIIDIPIQISTEVHTSRTNSKQTLSQSCDDSIFEKVRPPKPIKRCKLTHNPDDTNKREHPDPLPEYDMTRLRKRKKICYKEDDEDMSIDKEDFTYKYSSIK